MSNLAGKFKRITPVLQPMTPERAIEILNNIRSIDAYYFSLDFPNALQLAIKVLRSSIPTNIKRGLR